MNKIDFKRNDQWYVLGHPEDFLHKDSIQLLTSSKWAKYVSYIFIDEAHCVMQWGDEVFRPKYRELYQLRAIFPHALFTAVTATATLSTRTEICRNLGMINASVVTASVDRANIKYICSRRPSHSGAENTAELSYSATFNVFIMELKNKQRAFPKTNIYTGLKWCGFGHQVACQVLKSEGQHGHEVDSVTQYHAHLTDTVLV
jgi:superfamily II DNA helicase RecQ